MKKSRIEEIINVYFPESEYDNDTRYKVWLVASNVERETRQDAVSSVYDLANALAYNKGE